MTNAKDLDQTIEIQRTEEFENVAHELGDFIKTLQLTQKQNDQLVDLMVKQVNIAEHGAFLQGAGFVFSLYELEDEAETLH